MLAGLVLFLIFTGKENFSETFASFFQLQVLVGICGVLIAGYGLVMWMIMVRNYFLFLVILLIPIVVALISALLFIAITGTISQQTVTNFSMIVSLLPLALVCGGALLIYTAWVRWNQTEWGIERT